MPCLLPLLRREQRGGICVNRQVAQPLLTRLRALAERALEELGGAPRTARVHTARRAAGRGGALAPRGSRREQRGWIGVDREVAQPLLASPLAPRPSARASAWRCPSKRSRAYGTASSRESMKGQSLACSASSSRTAAGPAAGPAATTSSSAARVANASSATCGPDQVDRSPSLPQLLAASAFRSSSISRAPQRPAGSRRSSASSSRTSSRPCREHSSTTASSHAIPSYHQCPSSSVSSAQTARPPPGRPAPSRLQALAGAGDEVRGVLPGERERALVVVGLAVVAPRRVVVDGVVVVVAVDAGGRVAVVAPDERHRRAVDRHERHALLADERAQVLARAEPEAVGQLDAGGVHPRVGERRGQPRGVGALGQPEAAAPALAPEARAVSLDAGLDLRAHAGVGGEQRQHGVRGRGGPLRVRRERPQQVAAAAGEALERPLVVAPRAFDLAREVLVSAGAQSLRRPPRACSGAPPRRTPRSARRSPGLRAGRRAPASATASAVRPRRADSSSGR